MADVMPGPACGTPGTSILPTQAFGLAVLMHGMMCAPSFAKIPDLAHGGVVLLQWRRNTTHIHVQRRHLSCQCGQSSQLPVQRALLIHCGSVTRRHEHVLLLCMSMWREARRQRSPLGRHGGGGVLAAASSDDGPRSVNGLCQRFSADF